MGFYEAFAGVLTGEDQLVALHARPSEVRDRYGLSEAELVMLRSASVVGMDTTASIIRQKRLEVLTYILPAALAAVGRLRELRLVSAYLFETMPPPPGADVCDVLPEAVAFAHWLARLPGEVLPPVILDVARHELALFRLGSDPGAGVAARDWSRRAERERVRLGQPGALEGSRLTVPRAVAVASYHWDVLAAGGIGGSGDLDAVPACATSVLMQRTWPQARPVCSRIGALTRILVLACDGTQDGHEIARQVAGSDSAGRERVLDVLRKLAHRGSVLLESQ